MHVNKNDVIIPNKPNRKGLYLAYSIIDGWRIDVEFDHKPDKDEAADSIASKLSQVCCVSSERY